MAESSGDFNPLKFFESPDLYYTPELFGKLLEKQQKKGPELTKLYDTSITAAFQDLLNRSATPEEKTSLSDYLSAMDYRSAPMVTSALTQRLTMKPEFTEFFETKGPMTEEETKMSAYYGMPVRDVSGAKTGRYSSRLSPINYQMG